MTETKNKNKFAEILLGVPQGSIIGPLLLNIYICDLFLENSEIDIANYANDKAFSSDIWLSFLNFKNPLKNFSDDLHLRTLF